MHNLLKLLIFMCIIRHSTMQCGNGTRNVMEWECQKSHPLISTHDVLGFRTRRAQTDIQDLYELVLLVVSTTVTVTVTEALVLHPLLEDRGRITESIRILVPVYRMKQKYFQITTKRVRRSSVACSMLAVQQQKRRCLFVIASFLSPRITSARC